MKGRPQNFVVALPYICDWISSADLDEVPHMTSRNLFSGLAASIVFVLFVLILTSPDYLIYDEGAYLPGALLLADGHGLYDLLVAPFSVPTGPLYSVLHYLASPFTGLDAPGIRYVNFALLIITMGLFWKIADDLDYDNPLLRASLFLAVPMIWVATGMALTEMPTVLFMTLSVLFAVMATKREKSRQVLFLMAFSGLAFGLAITARQIVLPGLVFFLMLACYHRKLWLGSLLAIVCALAVCVPMFVIWGGLIPTSEIVQIVDTGINYYHGVIALCYLAVVIGIIAPGYYLSSWKWTIGPAILAALIGFIFEIQDFQVARGAMNQLPDALQPLAQRAISAIFLSLLAALAVATLVNLFRYRTQAFIVISICLMGGLTLTSMAISHQFSSRYILMAFPFALLALQPFFKVNWLSTLRLLAGAGLGIILLKNYYSAGDGWYDCNFGDYRAYCSSILQPPELETAP